MEINILTKNTYLSLEEKTKLHLHTAKELRLGSIFACSTAVQRLFGWLLSTLNYVSYSVKGLEGRVFYVKKEDFQKNLNISKNIELNASNIDILTQIYFRDEEPLDLTDRELELDPKFQAACTKFNLKDYSLEQKVQVSTSKNPGRIIAKIDAPGDYLYAANLANEQSAFNLSEYLKTRTPKN